MRPLLSALVLAVLLFIGSNAAQKTIVPGIDWYDTSGNLIEAHGGGVIDVSGTYYWFGEDKSGKNVAWVNVYSSTDLSTWTFKNHALARASSGDLGSGRVVERPKVIYEDSSKKYVMYFHMDSSNYGEAKVGVASSSTVDGVYTYEGKFSPNDLQSRDMTVFKDTDGQAYVIYSSNNGSTINTPLRITKLTSDHTKASGEVFHFTIGDAREAPAVVKVGSTYYMITSTTSGWDPNPVKYSTASSMSGPWTSWVALTDSSTTFRSQSAYIITVQGSGSTSYIYAGDRWQGDHLVDSRYVWLPLTIGSNKMSMTWQNYWTIDTSTGAHANEPTDSGTVYEAEATKNTLHGAAVSQTCGSGHCVGYIGKSADNYLIFNGVTATSAGAHTLRVYYPISDKTYRTAYISVNGGTGTAHKFPPTDNAIRSVGIEITLKEGDNTIKFYNNDAYGPDIDKITVSK